MSLSLAVPLAGRPGVSASAAGGYVGLGLRDVPADGTLCSAAEPDLPQDVLGGAPSPDLLKNPQ